MLSVCRCSVLAFLCLLADGHRTPMGTAKAAQCVNDKVMKALQSNGAKGVAYCNAIARCGITVTEKSTTTTTMADSTVTSSTTIEPTFTFTDVADNFIFLTTTISCSSPYSSPTSSSRSSSFPTATSIASDGKRTTTPMTATTTSPCCTSTPSPAPRNEGKGMKTVVVPSNLAGYDSTQVFSACGCLVVAGTSTVTSIITETSSTDTATELYTIMGPSAVQDVVTIAQTYTNAATHCLRGSAPTEAIDVEYGERR